MTERLILVGRVAGGFGVRGEVRITAYTDDPLALARYRELKRPDGSPALTILTARAVKGGIITRCQGIDDKDAADALRGLALHVDRAALPTPDEDEFYLADLVGLAVRNVQSKESIGKVRSVQNFGAGDLLEIEPEGGGPTTYLPFTRAAVPEIDIPGGVVWADPPQEVE